MRPQETLSKVLHPGQVGNPALICKGLLAGVGGPGLAERTREQSL